MVPCPAAALTSRCHRRTSASLASRQVEMAGATPSAILHPNATTIRALGLVESPSRKRMCGYCSAKRRVLVFGLRSKVAAPNRFPILSELRSVVFRRL